MIRTAGFSPAGRCPVVPFEVPFGVSCAGSAMATSIRRLSPTRLVGKGMSGRQVGKDIWSEERVQRLGEKIFFLFMLAS